MHRSRRPVQRKVKVGKVGGTWGKGGQDPPLRGVRRGPCSYSGLDFTELGHEGGSDIRSTGGVEIAITQQKKTEEGGASFLGGKERGEETMELRGDSPAFRICGGLVVDLSSPICFGSDSRICQAVVSRRLRGGRRRRDSDSGLISRGLPCPMHVRACLPSFFQRWPMESIAFNHFIIRAPLFPQSVS